MAMEITNNYGSYVAQGMAESSAANSTKKREKVNSKSKSPADYMSELAKLAPSVECSV